MSAINWAQVTETDILPSILSGLVNLISFLVVVAIGLIVSKFVKKLSIRALEKMNQPNLGIAIVFQALTLLIFSVIALENLSVNLDLLKHIIEIVLIIFGAGLALSFGLGTKEIARDLVYGAYCQESLKIGDRILFGEHQGQIVELKSVSVVIQAENGSKVSIPNHLLQKDTFKVF